MQISRYEWVIYNIGEIQNYIDICYRKIFITLRYLLVNYTYDVTTSFIYNKYMNFIFNAHSNYEFI